LETLETMLPGQLLEVVTDCSQTVQGIPEDAKLKGYNCLAVEQHGPLFRFLIEVPARSDLSPGRLRSAAASCPARYNARRRRCSATDRARSARPSSRRLRRRHALAWGPGAPASYAAGKDGCRARCPAHPGARQGCRPTAAGRAVLRP